MQREVIASLEGARILIVEGTLNVTITILRRTVGSTGDLPPFFAHGIIRHFLHSGLRLGERLGRSEGAVRFRLKSLGLSVKVKDGWSFRALQEMLHVGPSKLRHFVADGSLRVRDPRITASSLSTLRESRIDSANASAEPEPGEPVRQKFRKDSKACSWGSAAKLLCADVEQVRSWIVSGELKIVDGFVTERAFQEFCEKHGLELNTALLGDEVRDWLVEGYSLRVSAENGRAAVAANEKHALITRRCPRCRRPMRGNIFFKHIKNCKATSIQRTVASVV